MGFQGKETGVSSGLQIIEKVRSASMSWAEEELKYSDLGDRRRNQRLIKIVEDLIAQPNASVPQASRDNAAMQGMYEMWANRRIEPLSILTGHTARTVERCLEHPTVLLIQHRFSWN